MEALLKHAMDAGTIGLQQDGDRVSVTLNPNIVPLPPGNEEEEGEDDDDNISRVLC